MSLPRAHLSCTALTLMGAAMFFGCTEGRAEGEPGIAATDQATTGTGSAGGGSTDAALGTTDDAQATDSTPPDPWCGGYCSERVPCGDTDPRGKEPSAACARYCDGMLEKCAEFEFASLGQCFVWCGVTEASDPAAIACREEQFANFRPERPQSSCRASGPTADLDSTGAVLGPCSTPCESFCELADHACPDAFADGECGSHCASLRQEPSILRVCGEEPWGPRPFDCQLTQLLAALTDPQAHCPNVGPGSPLCPP